MIFLIFIILAAIVVLFSNKLAKQADIIEQNSTINAALIGIILALATSLPELATGLTSAFIGQPVMALSNVLGSNIFNTTIVAIINIYFFKELVYSKVKRETNIINYFVIFMYITVLAAVLLSSSGVLVIGFINISSFIIIVIYIISVRFIKEPDPDLLVQEDLHDVSLFKKAVIKFIAFAIIILITSMFLAICADKIMQITGLEASFVGAIFIGVTTSLPEFTSLITLVKIKQYDLGVSSVLGSNLFNFLILAVVDIFAKPVLYDDAPGVLALIYIGMITVIITIIAISLKIKDRRLNLIAPVLIIAIYLFYIFIGA